LDEADDGRFTPVRDIEPEFVEAERGKVDVYEPAVVGEDLERVCTDCDEMEHWVHPVADDWHADLVECVWGSNTPVRSCIPETAGFVSRGLFTYSPLDPVVDMLSSGIMGLRFVVSNTGGSIKSAKRFSGSRSYPANGGSIIKTPPSGVPRDCNLCAFMNRVPPTIHLLEEWCRRGA
jgi:hypothetical protein